MDSNYGRLPPHLFYCVYKRIKYLHNEPTENLREAVDRMRQNCYAMYVFPNLSKPLVSLLSNFKVFKEHVTP